MALTPNASPIADAVLSLLRWVPQNAVSRWVGRLARIEAPSAMQGWINEVVAYLLDIDRQEAARRVRAYESVDALFTRELEAGARPVASGDGSLVSPVDGTLGEHGQFEQGDLIQAKGIHYDAVDLLDSGRAAEAYDDGWFATQYLSPSEYHRIHAPVSGKIRKVSYVPGHLFPVAPFAVERVARLFAINERLVTFIDSPEFGEVAVVQVGAFCVGQIETTFDAPVMSEFETNGRRRRRQVRRFDEPVEVTAGECIGVFHLGSTVIVMSPRPHVRTHRAHQQGEMVQMGERLAGRLSVDRRSVGE
jgi:phosphatidylserine decarboxylase